MIKWVIVIAFALEGSEFWIESHYAPEGGFAYYETVEDCEEHLNKNSKIIVKDFAETFDFLESFEPPRCERKDIILKRFPDKPEMKPTGDQPDERSA